MANHQININSIAGRIGTSDIPTTANGFYDDQRRHDLYEFQLRQLEQNKKKKIKTRDSNCCSINFVTYVLHIFNILFFVSKMILKSLVLVFSSFKWLFNSIKISKKLGKVFLNIFFFISFHHFGSV